jgi:hypothetical protein
MQVVHESGHVIAARLSGGRVNRVILNPLTISRTDLADNPHPLLVVWSGPLGGCLLPLLAWVIVVVFRQSWAYLPRFFAGFCLIGNGAYIAAGAFDQIGDAGEMLRHGSPLWSLLVFGVATIPAGLLLWHRQGPHFGLGPARGTVNPIAAYSCFAVLLALIALGLIVDGE